MDSCFLWAAVTYNGSVGISVDRGVGKDNSGSGSVFLEARKASSNTKQINKKKWQC